MRALLFALCGGLIAACQPDATPPAFPQLPPTEASMDALVDGWLELEGPCLRLRAEAPEGAAAESYLVVWPSHVALGASPLRVTDARSGVTAGLGEPVTLSGGEVRGPAPDGLASPVPEACAGPYWLAGGIVPRDPAHVLPSTAPLSDAVTVAVLDTPPVDDIGYHRERLAEGPSAFRVGPTLYVDATALAQALGVPALATAEAEPGHGDAVVDRDGRRYVVAEVVGRVAGAFVYDHGPGQGVSVIPREVLPAVYPASPIGRAARAAGFEVVVPRDRGT